MDEDDGGQAPPFSSLGHAITALQTPSSSLDQKIVALRYLKYHVSTATSLDERTRTNINQLVLDNVLAIVLREDGTVDLRRRQLLRTECFLMLSSLLDSRTLFRGIDEKLVQLASDQKARLKEMHGASASASSSSSSSSSVAASSSTQQPSGESKRITSPGDDSDDEDKEFDDSRFQDQFEAQFNFPSSQTGANKKNISPNAVGRPGPTMQPPGGWVRSPETAATSPQKGRQPLPLPAAPSPPIQNRSPTSASADDMDISLLSAAASTALSDGHKQPRASKSTTDIMQELSVIRPAIARAPRHLLKDKRLRPRPSIFFDSEYELDAFVPGVDPTNWIEQDKRLGYQKPRMWFPVGGIVTDRKMVPLERNEGAGAFTPDRVVQEYMQMKALLSYVGDLVVPFQGKYLTRTAAGAAVVAKDGTQARPLARLTGVIEPQTYDTAMSEAVQIWTPLVGAHLPAWAKNPQDKYDRKRHVGDNGDDGSVGSLGSSSVSSSALSSVYSSASKGFSLKTETPQNELEKAVLVSQDALRRILKQELRGAQRTTQTLRETLSTLTHNDSVERSRVEGVQGRLAESLEEEKRSVEQSIAAIKTLTRETIRLQYASLPAKYLLIVEGGNSDPRAAIIRFIAIFCRVKRTNKLALAFGIWKICLAEAARKVKSVQYSKFTAVFLIKEWIVNRKFRQMKKWTTRWQTLVRRMIFDERNASVLPIQTLYRRWRDRCIIIRMHLQGPYNGPLSDVYLGPWRPNIKFKIPKSVRNSRRMFWQAAIQIQTRYRLFYLYRATRERRRKVILLQSIIRMWPKRMQFLRLKKWTIKTQSWLRRMVKFVQYNRKKIMSRVIQKYVRRYLGQLWRWRELFKRFAVQEKRLSASIRIQTRWREYWAKKRVRRMKFYIRKRDWAVLILQRMWYKYKRQFHTFVLMCVLRASEEVEIEFIRLTRNLERFYNARKIQRQYAVRFFARTLTCAIRLQCWWRGRLGYSLVDLKRKQLWASRKLHHWARGVLRRKNAKVRKIQRLWWDYKRGSLLQHLAWRARLRDDKMDSIVYIRRYHAACILQAHVKGMRVRYWVKRHRAALKIQPPLRIFLARQRRKRLKRLQNHKKVQRFVQALTSRLLQRRVKQILRYHSQLMIRPQALVRRFLVQRRFARVSDLAKRYGRAVLSVQRWYRLCKAVNKASAEVLAVRRADANPFRKHTSLHTLLLALQDRCSKLYSYRDPRVGLKLHAFLYRLGLPDLIPMFPKKDFVALSDLKNIKMQHLVELHDEWMERLDKDAKRNGVREAGNKKKAKPLEKFQLILDHVKPPMPARLSQDRALIQTIMCLSDATNPQECGDMIFNKFIKKFGEAMLNRASNWSEKIVRGSWVDFNNFQTLGAVTTLRLVHRCLDDSSGGAEVAHKMEELKALFPDPEEDLKWDKKRIAEVASVMQLAFERALKIVAETPKILHFDTRHNEAGDDLRLVSIGKPRIVDPVERMLDKMQHRVDSYRRKFGFLKARLLAEKKREAKEAILNPNRVFLPPVREAHWSLPEAARSRMLTIDEAVDLPFTGTVDQLDLELNMSIVRLYQQLFEGLTGASLGVQGLKDVWRRNAVKRLRRAEKAKQFVEKATQEYISMVNDDHVRPIWLASKRRAAVLKMFQAALEEARERREVAIGLLKWVPRYGFEKSYDAEGNVYWLDSRGKEESSYEMPVYDYKQWQAVSSMQRCMVAFVSKIREHKRIKEEEKQRQLALIEEAWLETLRSGQTKRVQLNLVGIKNGIAAMVERAKKRQREREQEQEEAASVAGSVSIAGSAAADGASIGKNGPQEATGNQGNADEVGADSRAQTAQSVASDNADDLPDKESTPFDEQLEDGVVRTASSRSIRLKTSAAGGGDDDADEASVVSLASLGSASVAEGAGQVEPEALTEEEIEASLPWSLRFASSPRLASGCWALLKTPYKQPRPVGLYPYPAHTQEDYGISEMLAARTLASRSGSRKSRRDTDRRRDRAITPGSKPGSKPGTASASVLSSRNTNTSSTVDAAVATESEAKSNQYLAYAGGFSYEVVVVFKFRTAKTGASADDNVVVCDCKTFKGTRYTDIPTSRLCLMNVDKGQRVEARYRGRKAFYRGTVLSLGRDHVGGLTYTIKYDDGEIENSVPSYFVRPAAGALGEWAQRRNAALKESVLGLKRRRHFLTLRKERMARLSVEAVEAEKTFALNWIWTAGAVPSPLFTPSLESVQQHEQELEEAALALEQQQRRGGRAYSSSKPPGNTGAAAGPRGLLEAPAMSVALQGMTDAAKRIQMLEGGVRVSLTPSTIPLKFGWSSQRGADGRMMFVHKAEGTSTSEPPVYRAAATFYAAKIQAAWFQRQARRRVRAKLQELSIDDICAAAIKAAKKLAYIGYKDEGVTVMQTVRRAGFSDVASAIESKLKLYPKQLAAITLDYLIDLKADRFESLGIVGEVVKSIKSLQKWYKATSPISRDKALKFVNWFASSSDERSLKAMLKTGEEYLADRLSKQFPQSTLRAVEAAKRLSQSNYPLTFAMVDNHLRKYGDKIDSATKENLNELINRPTTSTWREERLSLDVLLKATYRLAVVLGGLGIKGVRDRVREAEGRAKALLASAPTPTTGAGASSNAAKGNSKNKGDTKAVALPGASAGPGAGADAEGTATGGTGRPLAPGVEGRAAHVLREQVFSFLQAAMRGLRLIQRRARGFAKRSKLRREIKLRRSGVLLMQRFVRGCMARIEAGKLRLQQQSEWEQLWDPDRENVYFYNNTTGKSSYLKPAGPFRPLVRDRRSQALVQAWPILDQQRGFTIDTTVASAVKGLPPEHAALAPQLTLCAVCHVRKCIRLCQDCSLPSVGEELVLNSPRRTGQPATPAKRRKEHKPMPYCFPCFTQAHGANTSLQDHNYTVAGQGPEHEAHLLCAICDEPATRKCLGILDDAQIDELCSRLSRAPPTQWPELLSAAHVGGERKLALILDGILDSRTIHGDDDASAGGGDDSTANGDNRSAIHSYSLSHSPGHEALPSLTPQQMQKMRHALERTRAECDECYCDGCYREVHAGGKRNLHRWIGFRSHAPVCVVCARSPAQEQCRDCVAGYCSTCFKVFHATGRKRKHKKDRLRDPLEAGEAQAYCSLCDRRPATHSCPNPNPNPSGGAGRKEGEEAGDGEHSPGCPTRACEACFECVHKPQCDAAMALLEAQRQLEARAKEAHKAARDKTGALQAQLALAELQQRCVNCEEPADSKCLQCGDYYCSKTWMGNPGCFAKYHAKGRRAEHQCVSLDSLRPQVIPGGAAAWVSKKKLPRPS